MQYLGRLEKIMDDEVGGISTNCMTRWPGNCYRGGHMKLDDENLHFLAPPR